MSQENVDLVQAIYDGVLARGRLSDPATAGLVEKLFDPDVEVQQMEGVIGTGGTFRGYEGLVNSARELGAAFKDFYIVAERHFDGGENVVTVARGRATGRAAQRWTCASATCGYSEAVVWCAGSSTRPLRKPLKP